MNNYISLKISRNLYLCMLVSLLASLASTVFLFDLVNHEPSLSEQYLSPLLTISSFLSVAGALRYYFSTFLDTFFLLYKMAIIGAAFFWVLSLSLVSFLLFDMCTC